METNFIEEKLGEALTAIMERAAKGEATPEEYKIVSEIASKMFNWIYRLD